jgi:AcrR family transcriptional regulator
VSNRLLDPRFARTESLLKAALMDGVARRGFDSVRVDEICQAAGINRSTFYLHYRDKFELLEVCILSFFEIEADPPPDAGTADIATLLPGLFRMAAVNCSARRDFILRILEDGRFPAFHALFTKRMSFEVGRLIDRLEKEARASSSSSRNHQIVFLSSAFFGSLLHWIKFGTPEEMDSYCRAMAAFTMAILVEKR